MDDNFWKPISELPPTGTFLFCKAVSGGNGFMKYLSTMVVTQPVNLTDGMGFTHFADVPGPPVILTDLEKKDAEINKLKELLHFFAYPGDYSGREKEDIVRQKARVLLKNYTT